MQILLNLISHKTLFKNKRFHKACNLEVKMKEFGKINIFLIFVAYCLKRLPFTFQIIKCLYVWEKLLWLHSKYLEYEIQKIHFELGHPVQ